MDNLSVYQILSYGVIGLGFLLAFFAYRLLALEQQGTPREAIIKAIYYFMGFSILLCVIGFASEVYGRGSKEVLDDSAESSSLDDCRDTLDKTQMEKLQLEGDRKRLLDSTVKISDFPLISDRHFKQTATSDEILTTIGHLVKNVEKLDSYNKHYAYKLFELETMIGRFGTNIPTDLREDNMKAPYSKIQELLKGIGYYKGPINGEQKLTHDALVRFQREYNERAGRDFFDPVEDFGFFGYRTLEAVRSAYRRGQA